MAVNLPLKIHFHIGGKFEQRGKKIEYVGQIGCPSTDCDYDKFSLFELRSLLKEDCKYKGNVAELWWKNHRSGNELRRIITDKEVIDIFAKLGKCNIVHLYVIDTSVRSLSLPLVTRNFLDEKDSMTQTKELCGPTPTGNLDCVGRNHTSACKTPMELLSTRDPRITRSSASRQNGDLPTPTNGRDGSMAPTGKSFVKPRFIPPGSLGRSRVTSLKQPAHPTSLEAENASEMGLMNVPESEPEDGGTTTKKTLVLEQQASLDDPQLPSWFKRDVLLVHGEVGERCDDNSPGNDGSRETRRSAVGGGSSSTGQSRKRKRSVNFKPRGRNKVRQVATLKAGQKLEVAFYNNGPVGGNHEVLSRHIGKLVRDHSMLPIKVRSWSEFDSKDLDKLWDAIVDKFQGDGIEHRRKDIMNQARQRWNTWRGDLNRFHLKNKSSIEDAIKPENLPKGLFQDEWEWLVLEHFTDPEFLIKSVRNSENRAELKMLSRTGSRPIRDVIYEDLGAKNGKEPTIAEIFDATRKKKDNTFEEEDAIIYDKIVEESSKNPSISQFELVEKCFGVQDRGRVTCFGYGMKPKDLRGPEPSKADLKAQIQEKDQVIAKLTSRVETIEQLEATHQKEIAEKQATQEKEIGELHKEIKMLKELYFQRQSAP